MSQMPSSHVALSDAALDQLFRSARSHYAFLDAPITDETLRQLSLLGATFVRRSAEACTGG